MIVERCKAVSRILYLAGIITITCMMSSWATTYYISPTGSDGNNGTSATSAWQTISKANAVAAQPGDFIRFEGGKTFTGTVTLSRSGTAGNLITISSYGTGRATISSGTSDGISVSNCSYVRVANINVTGAGRLSGGNRGVYFNGVNNSQIDSVNAIGYNRAGINVNAFNGIRITNVYANLNGNAGILANGTSRDIYIGHCWVHNNPGYPTSSGHSGNGILLEGGQITKGLVEYCRADSNGWDQSSNHPNGPVGIWTWKCDSILIQYCISHNNFSTTGDGGGFDYDGYTTNTTIQYCYAYENWGAGYFFCATSSGVDSWNNTLRYCVSANNGQRVQAEIQVYGAIAQRNIKIYNNIAYRRTAKSTEGEHGCFYANGGGSEFSLWNNIFVLDNEGVAFIMAEATPMNILGNIYWDYNAGGGTDYWSTVPTWGTPYTTFTSWVNGTGHEKSNGTIIGKFQDPLLTNVRNYPRLTDPTQLTTAMDAFKLQSNSPCINSGVNVATLGGVNIGAHDFYGNPTLSGSGYDMGIHEYQGGTTTAPKMSIKGNNAPIATGDVTPSLTDFTSFDSVDITNATKDRTFKVFNATGTAALALTGVPKVALSGTNAADFSVTVQPNSPVAIGDSTTFTIRFDPSAIGVRTATVSITNNDLTANPYTFTISGVGKAATSILRGARGLQNKSYSVSIYSVNGSLKGKYLVDNAGYQKLMSTMPVGIYVMKMHNGAREMVQKISIVGNR